MVVYKKNGKDYLLMANTQPRRHEDPDRAFATAAPITAPSTHAKPAGVPFEKISAMTGIRQLDLLDATHSVVIRGSASALALNAVALP